MSSQLIDEVILRQWYEPVEYRPCWRAMQNFTRTRQETDRDEILRLEHHPVYALGIRGKREDAPPGDSTIPVVHSDRGGLITYHGPGQLVVYVLIDIRRRKLGLKGLVAMLEQSVIDLLATQAITGQRLEGAPGIYVDGCKLASLGLRMINGRTYHGLSLNVDMDLAPFERIQPCGLEGIRMTDLARLGAATDADSIRRQLAGEIARLLGYTRTIKGVATWTSTT